MRRLIFLTLLLVISSSFATVRADLKSQYNKGDCKSFYKWPGWSPLLCIDGDNQVFTYDVEERKKYYRVGSLNTVTRTDGSLVQFEVKDGLLIKYSCYESYGNSGKCSTAIKKESYKRVQP